MLLYVAYILYCKSGGSGSPKSFRMELVEKIISKNHPDELSATSGRDSINPSPLRLTSVHFPDVIEKNQIRRDSVLCAPVKEVPETYFDPKDFSPHPIDSVKSHASLSPLAQQKAKKKNKKETQIHKVEEKFS
ncbi:piggyBac transposable element-derived protein 4 [Trichonephila clavipes]|nr:piggyBac transposable element-derived protein 4 [Trichonephila clavipes]